MTKLNIAQWSALDQLSRAMSLAAKTGLLDTMDTLLDFPGSITDVLNAQSALKAQPKPALDAARMEQYVNRVLRQYRSQETNVFVDYMRDYEDVLRSVLQEEPVPNPVDLEFIRRAARRDFEQGKIGRARYAGLYLSVMETTG